MNRAELQRLAKERITDAKVLLAARHWSAAYYYPGAKEAHQPGAPQRFAKVT
jgi:hypothetical protein